MTLEQLQILITAETKQLKKELDGVKRQLDTTEKEVQRKTNSMRNAFKKVAAAVITLIAALSFTSAIKDAMAYEAALGQINRMLGANSTAFQRWADSQGKALGMAKSEAIQYGAIYANLLSGFTNDTAQLTQRTQDLLQASAVVASSTGRTINDVMERIRSGLLGNTEAIEDLGINVNIALIESTKAFREFANGKSWNQLDFNTQQTIRYFAILEQAAAKYGNELAQNTTSRQAMFNAHLKDARLHLGQAFLPIYNAVLPALTSMAQALANATKWLAAFMNALFGVKSETQSQNNAIAAQASALSDVGDAYTDAGKAAKKAMKSVAGFDQLNTVGGTVSSDGSGGAVESGLGAVGSGIDTSALESSTGVMEQVSTSAQKMAEKVRGAVSAVKSTFTNMKDNIKQNSDLIIAALAGLGSAIGTYLLITKWGSITATISKAFASIRTAITIVGGVIGALSPIALAVAAVVGILVGAFIYFYKTNESFRDTVHNILQKIGDTAKWLWDNVLVPFGKWLADVFVKAWGAVTKAAEWLWKNVLVPFGNFLKRMWDNVLVPIAKVIGEVLAIAFETVAKIAKSFWENVLVPLGKALSEMFEPAVEAVTAVLKYLWEKAFVPFGDFMNDKFAPIIESLAKAFVWLWENALKPVAKFVSDQLVSAFDTAFKMIGAVIEGVKNIFIGLMNFITGVFTGDWKKAWEGVKKIFSGIFGTLYDVVKIPLNKIIDGINTMIGGLNKLSFDIPDWVPGIGGKEFGINIPKIPKLAVGTNYVERDGLAYLHEGEAVVPKKYNPAAGGGDNAAIIAELRAMRNDIKSLKQIKAVIGQDDVGRAATGYMNNQYRRGINPLPNM